MSLPIGTDNLASSVIDGKWLLSGGSNDISTQSKTLLYEDGVFMPGPDMPARKHSHCQLTLNSTHIFFVGGGGEDALTTFILDWPSQEYTFLESLPATDSYPACGVINNPANGQGDCQHYIVPVLLTNSFRGHDGYWERSIISVFHD